MPYVPHSTLVGANLHYNMGDSRSAMAWTLAAGTADALLIENSNGNDLLSIETSTTAGLTVLAFGNATDRPQHEFYGTSFSLVVPDDQTVFQITANGETPVRIETSSTTPHTLRLNNAWVRMAEISSAPTNVAGSGFLYTRDDAGTTRLRFMRDDGSTVDLDNQGGGTPGGSDTQIQYNNAGAFGGMANVEHLDGNIRLLSDLSPSAPASGVVLHARTEGIALPASIADDIDPMIVGLPWLSRDVFYWRPDVGQSQTIVMGFASTGTGQSFPSHASGSRQSRAAKARHSITGTNSGAGRLGNQASLFREGGWFVKFRVRIHAYNSDSTLFVGCANSVVTWNTQDINTVTNCAGFGKRNTDTTNWHFFHNDGAGNVTAIDLGSDFALNTTSVLDFVVCCSAGGDIRYFANRWDASVTPVSGSVSSEIPGTTTGVTPRAWVQNTATSTTAELDLMFMHGWRED